MRLFEEFDNRSASRSSQITILGETARCEGELSLDNLPGSPNLPPRTPSGLFEPAAQVVLRGAQLVAELVHVAAAGRHPDASRGVVGLVVEGYHDVLGKVFGLACDLSSPSARGRFHKCAVCFGVYECRNLRAWA